MENLLEIKDLRCDLMSTKGIVDTMVKDGLWDAFSNYHMGTTAENICDVWGITREELDAFGCASQQKAEAAGATPAPENAQPA